MAAATPLSAVNLKLIERLRQLTGSPLDLSPWAIAALLDDCVNALKSYITVANSEVGIESEAYVPVHVIEQVGSVFKELSDNFFPMAHTTSPLRYLQIVDARELRQFHMECENLSREMIDQIERLRGRLDQIIHP